MKPISHKISKSFLWMMIVTVLMIFIAFNLIFRMYSQSIAKKELQDTMTSVELLIKQQLTATDLTQESILEKLQLIRKTLKISSLSTSAEFIIVDAKDKVRFPQNDVENGMKLQLLEDAIQNAEDSASDTITSFRSEGRKYYMSYREISALKVSKAKGVSNKLIFLIDSHALSPVMRTMNVVLTVIVAIAFIISGMVSLKLSKSISKPLVELSLQAKEIGKGVFLKLPSDDSSIELHELTQSMNDMSKRLTDLDKAQKLFLQNASHEIRTPLMSIQGYAEGISKGIFSDTTKTADIICEESKRLNQLVDELLTLSRIENNTDESEFYVLNLSDVMKEVVQKIEGYALREQKKINVMLPPDVIMIKANDALLSQAMINIISNGIKYAHSNVDIAISKENHMVMIKIKDDGDGIPVQDLPHIFDRFYKGKNGNFGLGLAIVKSAILSLKGSIRAYNENGAVFEIKFQVIT